MPSDMKIICPFCGHHTSLVGDPSHPLLSEGDNSLLVYTCPCGAMASSKEFMIFCEAITDDTDEIIREWWLGKKSPRYDSAVNYVTHTEPSMLLLWLKQRASPGA